MHSKSAYINWKNWFPAMEFRLYSLIIQFIEHNTVPIPKPYYICRWQNQGKDSGACITKVANNQLSSTPTIHQFKGNELSGLVFLCSEGKEHSIDEFIPVVLLLVHQFRQGSL